MFNWVTRTQSRMTESPAGVQPLVETQVISPFCQIASVGRWSRDSVTTAPGAGWAGSGGSVVWATVPRVVRLPSKLAATVSARTVPVTFA